MKRFNNLIGQFKVDDEKSNSLNNNKVSSFQTQIPEKLSLKNWNKWSRVNLKTMKNERSKANFNVEGLKHMIYGGKKRYEALQQVNVQCINDAVFRAKDMRLLSHEEKREESMRRVKRLIEYKGVDDEETFELRKDFFTMFDQHSLIRFDIHDVLTCVTIENNATEQQKIDMRLKELQQGKITGCFAMTELGHGSYIQGFETVAEFDEKTDEFVISSSTKDSMKWWIGGAAHTCARSVVFTRLIIKGKDYGVWTIFVPLRNLDDWSLYPGISIGDCGHKMGRNGIDNGWIQFRNVRVPRKNLLQKYIKVDRDGTVRKTGQIQLSYGALIDGRVNIAKWIVYVAYQAITIAVRYAVIRRQFANPQSKDKELQIMDYATHKQKLLPSLAFSHVYSFAAFDLKAKLFRLKADLAKGDMTHLAETHAISAGMKSWSTWTVSKMLEKLRQTLGGHGYSVYSGFPGYLGDMGVMVTWEGDNTVMALQTARYLLKMLKAGNHGKKLAPSVRFLENTKNILSSKCCGINELFNVKNMVDIFNYITVKKISEGAEIFKENIKKFEGNSKAAWNASGVELLQASKAFIFQYILSCGIEVYTKVTDTGIKSIYKKLLDLYFVDSISEYFGDLLEDGYFSKKHVVSLKKTTRNLLNAIREQAVPLTDALGVPDKLLPELGQSDGDLFTHYFRKVQQEKGSGNTKPKYIEEILMPRISKENPNA